MKKKILVLGVGGMAGHVLMQQLEMLNRYNIIGVARGNSYGKNVISLDVTDKIEVEKLVLAQSPDYIINCIGVLIKSANSNPANAIYINAYFPHQLEALAEQTGAKLIHISTDCVFSGKKGAYSEDDYRDGEDIYARTKILGEIINYKDLTIRTSIIGPELKDNGEGLFHWFMKQHGEISGYTTAYWSGVTTLELAKFIIATLESDLHGLIHLTTGEKIAKFNLLQLFQQYWQRFDINISPLDAKRVDKSLINTRTDFEYTVMPYSVQLQEMAELMREYPGLYSHYSRT